MAVTPTNWNRLKEIVADAIDAPEAERDALVAAACADDAELAAEAQKLIDAYGEVDGVVLNRDTDGWLGLGGPDVLSLGGQRIGRYRLVRVLGEGAMSAVYLARQANPDRDVAVKILRTALPLVDARARFRREATALARLRHPNIAVIYEAGLQDTADSRAIPFIAMEFVDGTPLTDYAKSNALDRRARIELIIKIAGAVQHAHQQTIVHRDLKPANVLVDATGTPKVLDFGIARIAAVDSERATWQTTAGLLLGTPGYMSPEQCAPDAAEGVDVRSDVWSLGVMLYELLLGRLPIEAKGGTISEVMRRLESSEPTLPHTIDPTLRGDLETILMTAVCRDKERRYTSAKAFADDLGRYLKQLPIEAHPPTTFYLASKFVRRHRGAFIASIGLIALLTAATIVSTLGFVQARHQRTVAERAEADARGAAALAEASSARVDAVSGFLKEVLRSPDPSRDGKDVTIIERLRAMMPTIAERFKGQPVAEAEVRSTLGQTLFQLGEYAAARDQHARAVELGEQLGQADTGPLLEERSRLAQALRWVNEPLKARDVAERALAAAVAKFGADSEIALSLRAQLAGVADDLEEWPEAERQYREVIEAHARRGTPSDVAERATMLNNLSNVMMMLRRYDEAAALLGEAIDVRSKLPKELKDPAGDLIQKSNLGRCLLYADRPSEALAILEPTRVESERLVGTDHTTTVLILVSQAHALADSGRPDEAIDVATEAVNRATRAQGADNDLTLRARSARVGAMSIAGRRNEAADEQAKIAAAMEAQYGADHSDVITNRRNLGKMLGDAGRYPEAISVLEDATKRTAAKYGEDSVTAALARNLLAQVYSECGRAAEAEPILRATMATLAASGGSPTEQAIVRRNWARSLAMLGRHADAEREYLTAAKALADVNQGRADARTVSNLADLYDATGRPDEAARVRATTRPAARPATRGSAATSPAN